jgi:hypothetical protein
MEGKKRREKKEGKVHKVLDLLLDIGHWTWREKKEGKKMEGKVHKVLDLLLVIGHWTSWKKID